MNFLHLPLVLKLFYLNLFPFKIHWTFKDYKNQRTKNF